jgi:hypothetical protein
MTLVPPFPDRQLAKSPVACMKWKAFHSEPKQYSHRPLHVYTDKEIGASDDSERLNEGFFSTNSLAEATRPSASSPLAAASLTSSNIFTDWSLFLAERLNLGSAGSGRLE